MEMVLDDSAQACVVCTASLEAAEGVLARWPFCHHDVCRDCVKRLDVCPICRGPGRAGFADLFPTMRPIDALRALPQAVVAAANTHEEAHERLILLEALVREAGKATDDDISAKLARPGVWLRRLLTALFLDLPLLVKALPVASLAPWLPRACAGWHIVLGKACKTSVVGRLTEVMLRVWATRLGEIEGSADTTINLALASSDQLRHLGDWALAEILRAWQASSVRQSPKSAAAWDELVLSAIRMTGPAPRLRYMLAAYGFPDQFPETAIGTCVHTSKTMGRLSRAVRDSVCDFDREYCGSCNAWSLCLELLFAERAAGLLIGTPEARSVPMLAYAFSLLAEATGAHASCKCKPRREILAGVALRAEDIVRALLAHDRTVPAAELLSVAGLAALAWLHTPLSDPPWLRVYLAALGSSLARQPGPRFADPCDAIAAWVLAAVVGKASCPSCTAIWAVSCGPQTTDPPTAVVSALKAASSSVTGHGALLTLPSGCLLQIEAQSHPVWHDLRLVARTVLISRGRLPFSSMPNEEWHDARWEAKDDLGVLVQDPACPAELVKLAMTGCGEEPHVAAMHATAQRGLPLAVQLRCALFPSLRNAWLRALISQAPGPCLLDPPLSHRWAEQGPSRYEPGDPGIELLEAALRKRQPTPGVQTAIFVHALVAYAPAASVDYSALNDPNADCLVKERHSPRNPPAGPLRWTSLLCSRNAAIRELVLLLARPEDDRGVCGVWRHVARAMYSEQWEPDTSAVCVCEPEDGCSAGLPPDAWDAVRLAAQTGVPPRPRLKSLTALGQAVVVALSAHLAANGFAPAAEAIEDAVDGAVAPMALGAAVSAGLWVAHRTSASAAQFQAKADEMMRAATDDTTCVPLLPAMRHVARVLCADPDAASPELASKLLRSDATLARLRLPAEAKKRLAAVARQAIGRAIESAPPSPRGAVPLVGWRVRRFPRGLSLALAVWHGQDLSPECVGHAVAVLRRIPRRRCATDRSRLAAKLLPCMLWHRACPSVVMTGKQAADSSGAVFRREQAAMLACEAVPWMTVCQLPPARITPVIYGGEARATCFTFADARPKPVLCSADWLVRIAAGGLRLTGWKRHTGTATVGFSEAGELHHLKRRARHALKAWSRSRDSPDRDDAIVLLSALLISRALSHRRRPGSSRARAVFTKVARRALDLRAPLLACVALAGRPVHGMDDARCVRRLKKLVAGSSAGLTDNLEAGMGWIEMRASCGDAVATHKFQSIPILLLSAAVFGPPCLIAGSGMVAAAHPSQNFALTSAWLAAIQSSA